MAGTFRRKPCPTCKGAGRIEEYQCAACEGAGEREICVAVDATDAEVEAATYRAACDLGYYNGRGNVPDADVVARTLRWFGAASATEGDPIYDRIVEALATL